MLVSYSMKVVEYGGLADQIAIQLHMQIMQLVHEQEYILQALEPAYRNFAICTHTHTRK